MNSYQGCENVQHCHWDMWTDCIIIQQRVYNLCLFVCSAERYGAHCCLYYIRCSYVLDFELWNMWFMEIIQISTSLEEDLLWWCIMLLHTTRMTFFHLWYSKKNKRQQNKWKIFCFMRNAWMRFESYHGNFGLFLTQSLWRLGFFLSLIVLSHAPERAFFFLCVPQKKDHTDFERHECEKIMTGYLLVMWNITAMSVFGQLKMAVRSIFPWGFKKGLDCIQPPKVTINPIYDQTESSS